MFNTFGLTGVEVEEKDQLKLQLDKKQNSIQKLQQQTQAVTTTNIKTNQNDQNQIQKTQLQPLQIKQGQGQNSQNNNQANQIIQSNQFNKTATDKDGFDKKTKDKGLRSSSSQAKLSCSMTKFTSGQNFGKIQTLNEVIIDLKQTQKIGKKDEKNHIQLNKDLIKTTYQKKITDTFNNLYKSSSHTIILKELKRLEHQKFLKNEIYLREEEMEQGKKMFNNLKYESQKKQEQLNHLIELIYQLEIPQPQQEQLFVFQILKEKEAIIKSQYEQVNFTGESLFFMCEQRKSILHHIKKRCKEHIDELYFKNIKKNEFKNLFQLRKQKLEEIRQNIIRYNILGQSDVQKLGPQFNNILCDELSEFEETRALKEIFKHQDELEREKDKKLEEEKKQLLQKQKQERDKAYEKIRKEKKNKEEELRKLRTDFEKIRKVTKVQDPAKNKDLRQDLELYKQYKDLNEAYHEMKIQQEEEIQKLKQDIDLQQKRLKELKYQTNRNSEIEGLKLDDLESEYIFLNNKSNEQDIIQKKVEKVIDEVCTVVSRILYQLQGRQNKNLNIEVKREKLLNMISVCGLKLERMLTILYKKKKAFRIENINADGTFEGSPEYIGLNTNVNKYLQKGYINVDDDDAQENLMQSDEYFMKKDDDLFEKEQEELIKQIKEKLKNNQ